MKKSIFILLAVVFLANSCADKTQSRIEVLVQDATEDTKVSIYEDRRGQNIIETVSLENGKAIFSAQADPSLIRFVGVDGITRELLPIVMEPGTIIINVGEGTTVKGTPLNERNAKFWSSLGEAGASDSERLKEYIVDNTDNALGVFYLNRYAYSYGLEDLKQMLAAFPAQYDDNETLNLVRANVKMQEETAVGEKFKDLKGLNPEGEEISLSDYAGKGKIVLVDFWASWCPPCRKDMPLLVEAYAKYKDKGFEIVGVSLDKTHEDWTKGISELNITWPQMSDLKYWESEHAKLYAIRSIPYTVLIDGEGTIIEKKISGEELNAKLSVLLK